jgi:hypothetical protein
MHSAPSSIRRAVSATLVLLLHLLLLAVLLRSVIHPNRPAAMREIFFQLPPRAKPATPLPPLPAMMTPPRGGATSGTMPSLAAPDIRGLGQALFGCAPENLGNLTPEQRSHCVTGFARPDGNAVAAPSTHVKDAARWANGIEERNTPGRIPCTYIAVTPAVAGGGDSKVPMAEFVCLHKLLNN